MEPKIIENDFEKTTRFICTPSDFSQKYLLYIQEIGSLEALRSYESKRENLASYLFLLVEDGRGRLLCDDLDCEIRKGECAFLDCRKYSGHHSSEDLWKLKWVHFYGSGMPEMFDRYLNIGGKLVFTSANLHKYESILDRLYRVVQNEQNELLRDLCMNRDLSELVTVIMEDALRPPSEDLGLSRKRNVADAGDFIREHYREQLTLDLLASEFFIDKYYLTRVFKRQFGVSVNQYISQIRVEQAKQLLRFSDHSIVWISGECGFGTASYFSRTFKKVEGVTPSEYRRSWKTSQNDKKSIL